MYGYQVDFYAGSDLIGSIVQDANGASGARLFAATTQNQPFDKVVINILDGANSDGFAIANVRYALPLIKTVDLDVKPGTCPNDFNATAKGVLPVAILGTGSFSVSDIDLSTLTLNGVAPLQSSIEDVSTPKQSTENCTIAGPDGNMDLSLKFDTQLIRAAMGNFSAGDNVTLTLSGTLKDGTTLEGKDVVYVVKK